MAFTPFVETDQPTMANFNAKFQELIEHIFSSAVVIRTYTGTGSTISIPLDFNPSAIIIISLSGDVNSSFKSSNTPYPTYYYYYNGGCEKNAPMKNDVVGSVELAINGNYIFAYNKEDSTTVGNREHTAYARFSEAGKKYLLLAFR